MPNRTSRRPSKARAPRIWARLRSGIAATNLLFWLPIAFLAATLTLWQWTAERERERIRLFTDEEASRISATIARRLQSHVDDSERTGRRWLMRDPGDPAEWDYDLFARRWLNPELATMELVGMEGSDDPDSSVGPEMAARIWPSDREPIVSSILPPELLEQATTEHRVVLAGPFFSPEGEPMTVTIASVERGGEPAEWVVSVYDLQQTLRFALQDPASSFGLSLVADGWTLFVSHEEEISLRETWARAVEFEYGDLEFDLYVWPTAVALESFRSQMPQIALIGGILATAVLALGILLAQVSSRRAGDQRLADSLQEEVLARKRAEGSLERKLEELSRSNQEFERFASAVSHDLRDPLNAIALNLQLVLTQPAADLDPKDRGHLERGSKAVSRLDSMLGRLLDYARAGGATDDLELVDTGEILDEAAANLQALVEEHGATVTSGALPMVVADRSALGRVLQNLLSNAIKYRAEQSPEVRVEARQGDDEWIFSVADNGRGMDEVQIGRAFDLFWREGSGPAAGEGLGLAACKRIIERHGGWIWIESSPGTGTTFFFSLPADPGREPVRMTGHR